MPARAAIAKSQLAVWVECFLVAEVFELLLLFFFALCLVDLCEDFFLVVGDVEGAIAGLSDVAAGGAPAVWALAAIGTILAARNVTKANTEISAFIGELLDRNNG